ncbi:MAG: DNA mismatch endonuclease Vsr [Acidobacteria bacterium]|nr:DNA mismatch endonuclease Vsr [Acidobacteriota bacterium]
MDTLPPEHRSENMRRIRGKDTAPEMAVRRLVHGMGFRYRLHVGTLPGKPDLVLPRLKRIIEVQGCFWHQHPGCIDSHVPKTRGEYWQPKLARNQQRDCDKLKGLQALGWEVLVVWECETRSNAKLAEKLDRFLSAAR